MNPFLKNLVKNREEESISEELDMPVITPEDRMDFWNGLATELKPAFKNVKVLFYGNDNGMAFVTVAGVKAAIIEFQEGQEEPLLYLNAAVSSNVAAKIALRVDKYTRFKLGHVFYISNEAKDTSDILWATDALMEYFQDVYKSEKKELERRKRETLDEIPEGETVH